MDIQTLIEEAVKNGSKALSEFDAKKVMAAYDIPITQESLVVTVDEAVQKAEEIGFPVVLKACSHKITHKTEGGLVEISLDSREAVRKSFEHIMKKAPGPLDGILVQEMVDGSRELMLGLVRDPQFGPCVMVGFGGIMTEIIKDTCFRMAPVDEVEAEDMLEEFKSKDLLGPFRGYAPVDKKALCNAITAIGAIGLENSAISEIDINPLMIRPDGRVTAVDALIVMEGDNHDYRH
jgi:acetate---CoA ligase (ADP-forming) subunit beta